MELINSIAGCGVCVTLLVLVVVLFYIWSTSQYILWTSLSIPGPRPLPLIGTALSIFIQGMFTHDMNMVRKYGKLVGTYEGSRPVLIVADLALLKEIMTKNFASFMDRQMTVFFSGKENYPIRKVMTRLTGDHWRHVRSHMTPAFSSGKLKAMANKIVHCASNLVEKMSEDIGEEGKKAVAIKSYFGAYTMDVIAATAFGLDLNSQRDANSPFVANAKKAMNLNITNIRTIFILLFPGLPRRFTSMTSLFPKEVSEFFVDIINRTIDGRQNGGQTFPDFLQLMMEMRVEDIEADENGQWRDDENIVQGNSGIYDKRGLTHEEILAQSFLFFVAGYETTAATLTFMAYALALNPDCQRRLLDEIDTIQDDDCGDYNVVNEIPYLEMCIHETLRLYPPAGRLMRVCTRDTELSGRMIRRGTLIAIPAFAIHRDPDLWPNPEAFNPDRWTAAEKASRDPYSYLPFGQGPRNCVGMRLALLEVKVAMVQMLRKYEFHVSEKTQVPLSFKKGFLLQTVDELYLNVVAR